MRLRSGKKLLQQQLAPPQRRSRAQQQPHSTEMPRQHGTALPPTLLSLPHELLGEVFKHLDAKSRKALFRASRTIASLACVIEQAQLQIDFSVTPLPTLHILRLHNRHTHIRCLTLSSTYRAEFSSLLDFFQMSSLEESNERVLLQGVAELRLKGWSIGEDACTTLSAHISELCPSVRTLHLKSMDISSTLFGALTELQELYIKRCFCSDSEEQSCLECLFAGLPLRSLHTLCLDVKDWSLNGVELLPELRHLQLGILYSYYNTDLSPLQVCPKLESVTFLRGQLSLFNSATLRKLVYHPRSNLGGPNLSMKACNLKKLYEEGIEDISLPAFETFELDRACLSGDHINPKVSAARLSYFLQAVSPLLSLDIKELIIEGRSTSTSQFEVLCMLEALAGRFEVQHLDCRIQLSDSGLQWFASLMPSGMQHVRLPLGSVSAACLVVVVLRWHKLEVLELVGAHEDAGLVWSLGEAVERCPDRQKTLQVVFRMSSGRVSSNFVDLCCDYTQWKQEWVSRWQQAALRFACSGRAKVELYVN